MSTPPPRDDEHRIASAFEVLHYNNSLIQFADQKANTLIVINSIFLATMSGMGGGSVSMPMMALKVTFFVACLASLFGCVVVILAHKGEADRPKDLLFFADILAHRSGAEYVRRFRAAGGGSFEEALLHRIFQACEIARDKFGRYRFAMRACVLATVLWVLNLVWIHWRAFV